MTWDTRAPSAGGPTGGIAVVGDVFCDIVFRGISRMPEWGEEVFGSEPVLCPGGAANVAVGLARLEVPTRLLARTKADDTIGNVLAVELARHEHLRVDWFNPAPATALTVALPHGTERAMMSYMPPGDSLALAPLIPWDELSGVRHLHIAQWHEGSQPLGDQGDILRAARQRGITTSIDISWQQTPGWLERIRELLGHVDLFVPNRAEACGLAECDDVEDALERLAEIVPTVVVKLGEEGAIGLDAEGVHRAPARPAEIVDTTGAGDAFAAGLLYGFTRRWPLRRSMALANVCGAHAVAHLGSSVSVPSRRTAFAALEAPGD